MLTKVVTRAKLEVCCPLAGMIAGRQWDPPWCWEGSLLGHVPPHGGVLAAQHQPKKSNTYQPLIEVRMQRLRCLLERYKGENPSQFGGYKEDKQGQARNVAAAVRGWENTLEHHNQVRRGEEEEEVNVSRFLSSDRSVFKLVFGGSNVLGLAPNLVTSSHLITLHSLHLKTSFI
jgi:hypothetical protein